MENKERKAILCVDDDSIILDSIKPQLTQNFGNDYIVETAESGEEALEIIDFLSERSINTLLIITDWLMPDMKGDELLTKVHKIFPNIETIMLSGQADKEAIENAFTNANMGAFITKPWDKDDLINKIRTLLKA